MFRALSMKHKRGSDCADLVGLVNALDFESQPERLAIVNSP
jgi:hypothetical protein